MAGLPRSFGPDVTDIIMRFAVGYPRDRLRDIANAIERIEHYSTAISLIEWRYNLLRWWLMVAISHVGAQASDSFRQWELRDEDRVKYYGDFCDAREPKELQQYRTHF